MNNRFLLFLMRWGIAGIFLYAGYQKVLAPLNFADSVASFDLLPNGLINLMALSLPPLEILFGLAVVTGVQRRPALLGLAVLIAVFMLALGSAIARGIAVDCGCFGSDEPSVWAAWKALLRDVPLLAVTVWLCRVEYRGEVLKC